MTDTERQEVHTASKTGPDHDTRDREGAPAGFTVKILLNETSNPPGKVADAELHFTDGIFEGLKLIGFAVWERRNGAGLNVTFPARSYSVNGERRSFALLRPSGATATNEAPREMRVRDAIVAAYEAEIR